MTKAPYFYRTPNKMSQAKAILRVAKDSVKAAKKGWKFGKKVAKEVQYQRKKKTIPKKKLYKGTYVAQIENHNGVSRSSHTFGKFTKYKGNSVGTYGTWNYNCAYHLAITTDSPSAAAWGYEHVGQYIMGSEIMQVGGPSEFNTTAGTSYGYNTLATNLFNTNPDQTNVGGALIPAQPTSNRTQKLVLKHVNAAMDITNAGNAPVRLKLLVYMAKQTGLNTTPIGMQYNELIARRPTGTTTTTAPSTTTGVTAIVNSGTPPYYYQNNAVQGDQLIGIWGENLSDVHVWRKFFKTVCSQTVILDPGCTHNYSFLFKYNWLVDKMLFENAAQNVAGKTFHVCIQAEGVPRVVSAKDGSSFGASLSDVHLAVLCKKKYVMTNVDRKSTVEYDYLQTDVSAGVVNYLNNQTENQIDDTDKVGPVSHVNQ